MKFRFHCLGLPHTATNSDYLACAYTQKILKFLKMMSRRGHICYHYGNEGSVVPDGVEHITLFSEKEREYFFGAHNPNQQYFINWDWSETYWQRYSQYAKPELAKRCRRGDFICLITAPSLYRTAIDQFPGAYSDVCYGPMAVEYGVGYYGVESNYRCFESSALREYFHGMQNNRSEYNNDAVIPNYFDVDEFDLSKLKMPSHEKMQRLLNLTNMPYYLFLGRVNNDKGVGVALDIAKDLGIRLIIAGALQNGQNFDPNSLPDNVIYWGSANLYERAYLLSNCIASFAPTHYREPFDGVSVEAQLCGRPCITTDHACFIENCEAQWRCASHMEFIEATKLAATLTHDDHVKIKEKAFSKWSFDAVAPQYERYFSRLFSLWGDGWYEKRSLEQLALEKELL